MLDKLKSTQPPESSVPATLPEQLDFDLTFLDSSPLDGTELQQANLVLNSALQTFTEVPSLMKRFVKRATDALEMKHSELLLVKQQNEELKALLGARRIQNKGKRIALKGQFIFSTAEVLKIAKQAEAETAAKKVRKRPQKRKIEEAFEGDEIEEPDDDSTDSESSCIVVASRNQQLNLEYSVSVSRFPVCLASPRLTLQ